MIHRSNGPARVLAGGVLAATVLLLVAALSPIAVGPPFVWRDVAIVHLACALPLAGLLAVLAGRLPPAALAVGAAGLLGATALALASAGAMPLPRTALALGLATAGAACIVTLVGPPTGWPRGPAAWCVCLAVLLVPPIVYTSARCQHDLGQLGGLLEQSRLGEAGVLARAVLALEPAAEFRGEPLVKTADAIDATLIRLASRPAPADRVERARLLAVLGDPDGALALLEGVGGPDADVLRGTVRESAGEWSAALEAYRRAESASPGLLRAATGVAYCERKLGRYEEAETAYRRVLNLSPTADSHFLLARFYEDAQQAGPAANHARRAADLAPDRYDREAGLLIRRLAASQFGCLGVATR